MMTFSELVVKSRRRVHDYREPSGTIIRSADQNGIKWIATDLQDACQEAMSHLIRDLISYKYKNFYNESYLFSILNGAIKDGVFTFADTMPEDIKINDILKIEQQGNRYGFRHISPSDFFSTDYMNSLEAGVDYVFTRVKNASEDEIITMVFPSDIEDNARAVCSLDLNAIFVVENKDKLPFIGIDDLMLDYVEANCKQKEYDMQQFGLVSQIIDKKLQLLKMREVKQ